jgi:signal peptidase I
MRRPWVAALLSSFVPGLGQMYNGQLVRGVLYVIALCVCAVLLAYTVPLSFNMLLVATLAVLLLWLAIIIEAGAVARRTVAFAPRRYNHWFGYVVYTVVFLLVVQPAVTALVQKYVFDVIEVQASTMSPALIPGDRVLVRRTARDRANVRRPQVVAIAAQAHAPVTFERVVAAGGDTLEGDDGGRTTVAPGMVLVQTDSDANDAGAIPRQESLRNVTGIARYVVMSLDESRRLRLQRMGAEVH